MIRVLLILAWRFCSGRELDGDRRTNATWRLPAGGAQAVLVRGGRTSWWVHQSLRYRAAVRLAALAVLVVFWWGMVHDPAVTMLLAQVVVGLAVLAGLRAVAYRVAERPHHRRLWRLHRALAPQVGWPVAGRRPGSWLTVPWDFLDDPDAQIRVRLPAGYIHTGKKAEEVERTVAAVLGVPDPDFADDYERRAPVLYMGRLAPPPELLPLAEVTDLLGEATDGEPLLGLAARDDPVVVNLDSESPHVAISAGTGAGKSVLLMGMAAQELRHGANLLIFDIKRTSHLWAVGLPGVVYCRTPEQIHIALVALGEEVDRRYRLIEAAADLSGNVDPTIVGPRLLILAEELNATMAALHAYWMSIRPPGSPPSPALLAWNKLLYMGRAGRMHVLGVAQRLSARAGGGGDARENLGRAAWRGRRRRPGGCWPRRSCRRRRRRRSPGGCTWSRPGWRWRRRRCCGPRGRRGTGRAPGGRWFPNLGRNLGPNPGRPPRTRRVSSGFSPPSQLCWRCRPRRCW